jgi:hypothetical protein
MFAGALGAEGGVVSTIVNVAIVVLVFPQASVAVKVTVAVPVSPQSSLKVVKSLDQITLLQESVAVHILRLSLKLDY